MVEHKSDFGQVFGAYPDLSASAPGRVNLIGEHIDYSGGFVLPFAIEERTYVSVRKRDDGMIRVSSSQRGYEVLTFSIEDLQPGHSNGWERYPLGVMWALGIEQGVDLLLDGRVPLGAGLSSSAALECAVAVALNETFALNNSLESLAYKTQRAENDFVGVPCGIMDQSVSLMARAGNALLIDCRDLTRRYVPLDMASHGLELLIIDTQAHHALIDGGYAERRESCESVSHKLGVESLRDACISDLESSRNVITHLEYLRARHAITEMDRVLQAVIALENGNFLVLGKLLNESHNSLRDDYDVSSSELNATVTAALGAGAIGARMIGGGFGGSAIALVRQDDVARTKSAIERSFYLHGFKAPRFFTSSPSAGAGISK